jgi:hypothetical protein
MIPLIKMPEPQELPKQTDTKYLEQIAKAVAERHKRADTDGTRRRARQTAKDNRLI